MLDRIANLSTKAIQYHLTDSKEGDTKEDITYRPSIIQSPDDKDELSDNVDEDANKVENVHVDPKCCW